MKCKLPFGTFVKGANSKNRIIFSYLNSCEGIANPRRYEGSSSSSFGLNFEGEINYDNDLTYSDRRKISYITFAEYEALIAKPVEEVVENYQIF